MITVDETHIECLPESHEFEIFKTGRKPRLIIGYRIETKYDHDRHRISPEHDPVKLRFLSRDFDNVNEWYYIYGIEFPVNKKLTQLHHTLVTTDDLTIDKYYDYLELYDYSCTSDFLLLRKNLYIIDNQHIADITVKYKSYDQLKQILKDPEVVFYQNCDEFKIFLTI